MKWTLFSIGLGVAMLAGTWWIVRGVETGRSASRVAAGARSTSDTGAHTTTDSGFVGQARSNVPGLQDAEPATTADAMGSPSRLSDPRIAPVSPDAGDIPSEGGAISTPSDRLAPDPEPNRPTESVDYRFFSRAAPIRFERPQAPQPLVSP